LFYAYFCTVEKTKQKKIGNYIWNGLFVLIILVLLIPSWRVAFQSTIQRLFLTSIKLEQTQNTKLEIQPNEWMLYNAQNEAISFHELSDKPIVLNFWATWCPPCVAELPGLYDFYNEVYEDAYVIAVSTESIEKLNEFGAFSKYKGMIYRIDNQIPAFNFSAYPSTFILAPNFRLIHKITGAENFMTKHNINFIKNLK
jgi:thiol-disulfide isomerase/thioredoxin